MIASSPESIKLDRLANIKVNVIKVIIAEIEIKQSTAYHTSSHGASSSFNHEAV